ncbi:MAG: hypothetical protein IJ268_06145 [Proteobacteria bacterium]|nr:hypothetical protein [Pseudomonadota bacterium]MBQ9242402.1 hypothetical protein [Pseudomonadota bacterium]
MSAYHNLMGPPRSTIHKVITPVGRQIFFNFSFTNLHIPYNHPDTTDDKRDEFIQLWLTNYIYQHKAELDAITRPMIYMIANICENIQMTKNNLKDKYPGCHVCCDPILTLAILGRISGNIYVPQREIRLSSHSAGFDNIIAFPAKSFSQLNI